MPLHDVTSDEFSLYAHGLKKLNDAGAASEFHKVAELSQERDLMHDANRYASRVFYLMNISDERWNNIFGIKE